MNMTGIALARGVGHFLKTLEITLSKLMQEKSRLHAISVVHLRAAKGLLDWTDAELAEKSGVSFVTISNWVTGKHRPTRSTKERIRKAFEDAGVEFLNGGRPGVRLSGPTSDDAAAGHDDGS